MSNNQNSNTGQGEKENKKVILLDLSRTERAFEGPESLWDIEIEKIEERLTHHIESLEDYKEEKDSCKKPLLSIAILGYPGSGKTSMLHTLVERVNRENPVKKLHQYIASLPVLKSNLVAEGDHFLYAFLAEALRADRKQHRNEDGPDRDTPFISPVQHKFQEVSEYLQVFNETGYKHEGDTLGVSLERLERHESGLMLIEEMAGFIDELANSLAGNSKSSVVLLPVDDADISREALLSALDTCWRFIKHPRLVPMFTFTGRIAEELLRVHYDEKINKGSSLDKLKEASTSLMVMESMAIQYFGRLFPVRNCIKMGPASARVQAAAYKPLKGGKEKEVSELLKTASRLLFGHPKLLTGHSISPPLRLVTLRRQIQIIDAIQCTGIEQFMKEKNNTDSQSNAPGVNNSPTSETAPCPLIATVGHNTYKLVKVETQEPGHLKEKLEPEPWSVIFDRATWSLLNAHRDVLKEIHLNLDDLYSWTPKGLRQVILDCILTQKRDDMNKLHRHWRYGTADRRSQIISLLAVNIFRPRMDEEPTGDDAPGIIDEWWDNYKDKNKDEKKLKEASESFPVIKGALWFLNLCIEFYLPQVFSWRGLPGNKEKDMETIRVTGIGWGLKSGPLHAVREALKKKKVFSSGILFLDPVDFNLQLKKNKKKKKYHFFVQMWCYYGFHGEWPWAAVSLWRGLGLMGRVIEVCENYQISSDDNGELVFADKDNPDGKKLKKHIGEIIKRHFESARVFINLPKGKKIKKDYRELNTKNWEYKDDAEAAMDTEDSVDKLLPVFADAMFFWLKENWSAIIEIKENGKEEKKKKENRIKPMEKDGDWASSFIRRLHGESLVSIFWQDLDNTYFKKKLNDWSAGLILYQWKKLLSKYWDGCNKIKILLESCPIWPDFKSHDLYQDKSPKFDWGDVGYYSLEEYERELDEAYKKMGDEEALEKLKNVHEIKNEKEFIKKLEAENQEFDEKKKELEEVKQKLKEDEEQLNTEKEKLKKVKEINKKDVEENIKKLEGKINNFKKYNKIVEREYQKIGIKRANLENYLLFSDDEKPSEHEIKGSLIIPEETKGGPGKEIKFNAVVSIVVPKVNKKDESNDKGKEGTGVSE